MNSVSNSAQLAPITTQDVPVSGSRQAGEDLAERLHVLQEGAGDRGLAIRAGGDRLGDPLSRWRRLTRSRSPPPWRSRPRRPRGRAGPATPAAPRSPGSPLGPGAPGSPFAPVSPFGPASRARHPSRPSGRRSPLPPRGLSRRRARRRPVAPVGPAGPVIPLRAAVARLPAVIVPFLMSLAWIVPSLISALVIWVAAYAPPPPARIPTSAMHTPVLTPFMCPSRGSLSQRDRIPTRPAARYRARWRTRSRSPV